MQIAVNYMASMYQLGWPVMSKAGNIKRANDGMSHEKTTNAPRN